MIYIEMEMPIDDPAPVRQAEKPVDAKPKKTQVREKKYRVYNNATREQVSELVKVLSPDRQWEIIIKPYQERRSTKQNNLYWKWLGIIADEIGDDANSMHDTFRKMFLPVKIDLVLGIERQKLQSTSDPAFTTAMMGDYMNKIQAFAAAEMAIILPSKEQE